MAELWFCSTTENEKNDLKIARAQVEVTPKKQNVLRPQLIVISITW